MCEEKWGGGEDRIIFRSEDVIKNNQYNMCEEKWGGGGRRSGGGGGGFGWLKTPIY